MPERPDHFLLICATCAEGRPADTLHRDLAGKLPHGFAIRTIDCMAGCDRPRTVGFQATGKAQYLFGDIQTKADVEALAQFALQYQNTADGWTNATDRPPALLTKTLSRLPAIHGEGQA